MQIILDIGVNYYELAQHDGTDLITAAAKMIKTASLHDGITAVKFQWYKANKLVTEAAKAYWDTDKESSESQIQLFRKYDKLEKKEYEILKKYCDEYGIEFMATAFDSESLEQLNPLVKRHKIASADITNYELLKQVADYKKPVILSTGAATYKEISQAMDIFCGIHVTLLHCMLCYPCEPDKSNLWHINYMKNIYGCDVGYSDHCAYNPVLLSTAYFMGARLIEKHFTMTPEAKGNDHYHAVPDKQLHEFSNMFKQIDKMLSADTDRLGIQSKAREMARRGVYLKRDVKAGEIASFDDVEFLRPQLGGITPMQFAKCVKQGWRYGMENKKGEQL